MIESLSAKIYSKLPVWTQNVACTLYGFKMRNDRYNKVFHNALEFLEQSQWWSLSKLLEYQQEQLQKLITHSYKTVPYYKEIFDQRKLKPDDIKSVEDLKKLPLLEKIIVRERFDDLISQDWPKKRFRYTHTGGTTGTALNIVVDKDTQPWNWATVWRNRCRFGIGLNDSYIVFAGRNVVPLSNMAPPFWRRNEVMHQTYVSLFHMTKQNMPALVDYLQKRKVAYYSGYPSALYLLAGYLSENAVKLESPPKMTFTGSETLLPHQRRLITETFKSDVADLYGVTEQCGMISECEKHSYHVDMEYGIIEFLPIEGMPDNIRQVVCTGFTNYAMPLIRYRLGDIVTISNEKCSCGRESPVVKKIDGRIESYIVTPDGRQVGRLDFLFKDSSNINEAQLIQETDEDLTVKVVKSADYKAGDERSLLENIKKYLGDQINVHIEYVKEIPREKNGKFRQIISKVFKDRYTTVN